MRKVIWVYYTYIIRCSDNSLYCGITTDIKRRFNEHKDGKGIGAKYTRSRKPKMVEVIWNCANRSDALKLECAIKKSTRTKKEELIANPSLISVFFDGIIDTSLYNYDEAVTSEIKNFLQQAP